MKIKMVVMWKIFLRSKNVGIFFVIYDWSKIVVCRKFCLLNSFKYSIESVILVVEEFSFWYLDGKYEGKGGKIFCYKIIMGYYEFFDWLRI